MQQQEVQRDRAAAIADSRMPPAVSGGALTARGGAVSCQHAP
jgi:hypothetical protein